MMMQQREDVRLDARLIEDAIREALELAAKKCEEVSYDFRANGYTEKRKDQINYNQRSIGADACAARIRALKGE